MAKDLRTITGAIRVSGKGVFTTGMEDEFEAAANADEISRLSESGLISGFGAKAEQSDTGAETKAPEPKGAKAK